MENLGLGLQLMLIGMVTVFIILMIVIYGSQLLIKIVNKVAPAENEKPHGNTEEDLTPVFEAAVEQITGGKGRLTKVTKLK
ncbi:MAG TPA: oxaloacetate decarboxylase [Rikenellaceae bacterium]|nr:oxaloacetate decarboxylase [Rikenellaceae bacterium]